MPKYFIHLTGCLLGTTLMFSTPMVIATETSADIDIFDKQWYLGAGLGRSTLQPDTDGTGFSLDDKNDTGYKFFAGYDFTERFSLEGYFSRLGQSELSPNGTVKYQDFGISALYYLYKSRQPHVGWGIFGRGGIGRMKNTVDIPYERENDNHIMFGAGVEYGFNNGLALRLDADFYDSDAQLVAINILKRFGADKKDNKPQPVAVIDSDNDGIANDADRCPDSAADTVVDSQGCELDSDNDGVVNSQDRCSNSPAGKKVDAYGCELDSDNDGVADSRDSCPNSPADVKVDPRGCELDSDSDGVTDNNDRCPDTPAGIKVGLNGCEPDSDGDGVTDNNDNCPNSATGAKVDTRGCELDDDADGIINSQDLCLETPSEAPVDTNGCKLQATFVLKGVTFATASAELIGGSRQVLNNVVETLRLNPELKLEVAGYTDNRGKRSYNIRLSQQRADSVRNYLITQGIASERLEAKGYGPADAIADNGTEDGRATNRRVTLHIIE